MYTRRGRKSVDAGDAKDLAEKHQHFVEKMQNPTPVAMPAMPSQSSVESKTSIGIPEDVIDGNVNGSMKMNFERYRVEELPDGSHISPVKVSRKDRKSVKDVEVS